MAKYNKIFPVKYGKSKSIIQNPRPMTMKKAGQVATALIATSVLLSLIGGAKK